MENHHQTMFWPWLPWLIVYFPLHDCHDPFHSNGEQNRSDNPLELGESPSGRTWRLVSYANMAGVFCNANIACFLLFWTIIRKIFWRFIKDEFFLIESNFSYSRRISMETPCVFSPRRVSRVVVPVAGGPGVHGHGRLAGLNPKVGGARRCFFVAVVEDP